MKPDHHPHVYVSTSVFPQGKGLTSILESFSRMGIRKVELSGGCAPCDNRSIAARLAEWSTRAGLDFIVHNYFPVPEEPFLLNIAATDSSLWAKSVNFCIRSLELAADIGSPIYGVHPGYAGRLRDRGDGYFFPASQPAAGPDLKDTVEHSYGQLLRAIDLLSPVAERYGVKLCVENLFPQPGLPPQHMVTPYQWKHFFRSTKGSNVGFLLDLAHARVAEYYGYTCLQSVAAWAAGPGRTLLAQVHVSENNGRTDYHGSLEFGSRVLEVARSLSHTWPVVPVTCECRHSTSEELPKQVGLISEAFRQ